MAGVNKAILVGNVGQDPDIRFTGEGNAVANLSLATSEKYKGEPHTEWHKLVAFRKTAELIQQYVKKGTRLFVEGKIQTRKWEDKEGNNRYTTEIVVNNLQFLGGDSSSQETVKPAQKKEETLDDDIPFGDMF